MASGEYSEMIELPVSTCEMVIAPAKKKRFFKNKLLKKVNRQAEENEKTSSAAAERSAAPDNAITEVEFVSTDKKTKKAAYKPIFKNFRFDVVAAEVIAVFALVVAILLTNVFWEDSGINTMIRTVFGGAKETETDTRAARELAVSAPSDYADMTLENGYMTFNSAAAVYAPANGKVTSVIKTDGGYTLTIAHSDVFSTVISGADGVYISEGDMVYSNIPVAYAAPGTTVAMYDGEALVTDFIIDNGKLLWQN